MLESASKRWGESNGAPNQIIIFQKIFHLRKKKNNSAVFFRNTEVNYYGNSFKQSIWYYLDKVDSFFFLENIALSKENFQGFAPSSSVKSWETAPVVQLWGPLILGTDQEVVTLSNGVGGEGSMARGGQETWGSPASSCYMLFPSAMIMQVWGWLPHNMLSSLLHTHTHTLLRVKVCGPFETAPFLDYFLPSAAQLFLMDMFIGPQMMLSLVVIFNQIPFVQKCLMRVFGAMQMDTV